MHSNILKITRFALAIVIIPTAALAERKEYISRQMPQEVIEILESDTILKMSCYRERMEDPLYPSDLTTVNLRADEYYNSTDEDNCEEPVSCETQKR